MQSGPNEIAKEIYDEKLSQEKAGEILGDPLNENTILKKYAKLCDFRNKKFVDAIKLFLDKFKLPGEAQKIDRIMKAFADAYFDANKNTKEFADVDAVYVLAFSVIMLNTDRHNPSIQEKDKITLEGFIKNNRGMNKDSDFNREFLKDIYKEIDKNPIPPKLSDIAHSIIQKSIKERYKTANTRKIPIIGRMKIFQNKSRSKDIKDLQALVNNIEEKMKDNNPNALKEAIMELQVKMDEVDDKISKQSQLLGKSRLHKVIEDIRKDIAPIVKQNLAERRSRPK